MGTKTADNHTEFFLPGADRVTKEFFASGLFVGSRADMLSKMQIRLSVQAPPDRRFRSRKVLPAATIC